jgi:type IV/VI secretion system ImpK/VasF family protein
MTTMPELFAPFFAYVLLLDEEYTAGHGQRAYEEVRHDLTALLQEQETTVRHQGVATQAYQVAREVVIAWADEMLLRHTAWEDHERWRACPLQAEYAETSIGVEPDEALQGLLFEQPEVREVYTLCLGLGFSGLRHSGLSDRLRLAELQGLPTRLSQSTYAAPLLASDVWTFDFTLMPQPYEAQRHVRWPARRLLTCAVALLVVLSLGLWLVWRHATEPCLPPAMARATIAPMLADLPCAQVSAVIQGCTVTLSGRVESADQQTSLHRVVQSIASPMRVDAALHIVPRPFCEVLALLESVQTRAAPDIGLVARPNKSGAPPVYVQGEDLSLEVTTPGQFASYLYVDFYDHDGRVQYLFFNPALSTPFPPQSVHTLGYTNGQPVWGIGPPYGRGLITVIASKAPLVFPPLGPGVDSESAAFYLTRLRQALPQDGTQAEVAATFFFIETRAQAEAVP